MTLYCKCMRTDCPNEHWADSPEGRAAYAAELHDVPVDLVADPAEDKEDKSWPPNTMETK